MFDPMRQQINNWVPFEDLGTWISDTEDCPRPVYAVLATEAGWIQIRTVGTDNSPTVTGSHPIFPGINILPLTARVLEADTDIAKLAGLYTL